jgi:hypothetical protein
MLIGKQDVFPQKGLKHPRSKLDLRDMTMGYGIDTLSPLTCIRKKNNYTKYEVP